MLWRAVFLRRKAEAELERLVQGGEEWWSATTASGERLVAYRVSPNPRLRWTLRGLEGRVLRKSVTESATGQSWVESDPVYRGPGEPLLAAHGTPGNRGSPETLFVHTDHLGSVRFLTDGGGHARSYHAYLPFGEEATATHSDLLRYRFTGDERELLSPTTPTDDLDNLHARIGNPMLGRFTSTDPVQAGPGNPQAANRYAYVQGNPLTFTDPTGEMATAAMVGQWIESSIEKLKEDLTRKVTTGGVGGVVAATAVGSTLDLVSLATDGLKAGDAVGTAVGSGAGAGKVALAFGQDALRTAGLLALLVGVGRSVASRVTVEVVHFTDDAGKAAIHTAGSLRAGTYVTRASEVRGLTPRQIESTLEILPGRGEHSFAVRTRRGNLAIPENGARTSGGAYQRQLKAACAVSPSSCAPE